MDKSIEQRAEERYPHDAGVNLTIPREAWIEGYKACQQNLEVEHFRNFLRTNHLTSEWESYLKENPLPQESDNLEVSERLYTQEEMKKAMLFSFDTFTVAFSRLEIERRIERYLESLPKANS